MVITLSERLELETSPEVAFDFTIDSEQFTDFKGYGPIPGIVRAVQRTPGPAGLGTIHDVSNSDGSTHEEEIIVFSRPVRHVREIRSLKPPFAWLVARIEEEWSFAKSARGCEAQRAFRFEIRSPLLYPIARLVAVPFGRAMNAHARTVTERLAGRAR